MHKIQPELSIPTNISEVWDQMCTSLTIDDI